MFKPYQQRFAQILLPALNKEKIVTQQFTYEDLQITQIKIINEDDVVLDIVFLAPINQEKLKIDTKLFFIKFCDNYNYYEECIDDAEDANVLNATVVGFNYRGVG